MRSDAKRQRASSPELWGKTVYEQVKSCPVDETCKIAFGDILLGAHGDYLLWEALVVASTSDGWRRAPDLWTGNGQPGEFSHVTVASVERGSGVLDRRGNHWVWIGDVSADCVDIS